MFILFGRHKNRYMVLGKLLALGEERLARKYGVTWGSTWHDPDLVAALPLLRAGDIATGLSLLDTPDPQLRSLRLDVLSKEAVPFPAALEAGMDHPDPEPDLLLWAGTDVPPPCSPWPKPSCPTPAKSSGATSRSTVRPTTPRRASNCGSPCPRSEHTRRAPPARVGPFEARCGEAQPERSTT